MAPMWKKLKKRWSWRTNIISWPCILVMHSTWMQTQWNNYWSKNKDVWVTYLCCSNRKITGVWKASRKNCGVVLRHGRTRPKMRWEILRAGKQESGATVQSFQSLPGWSSIQAGGTRNSWRIIRSLLTNCLDMLVRGTDWKTRHPVVGEHIGKISHQKDRSLWQTISSFDFKHSSHKWLPTILSCG